MRIVRKQRHKFQRSNGYRGSSGRVRCRASRVLGMETLETRQLLAADLSITEFLASNGDTIGDGDGNSFDWLEVHNAGDAAVDLTGYRLTDDPEDLDQWTFPSIGLDPGGYLVVFASGQDRGDYVDAAGNLHTSFRLSVGGEYLALVSPEAAVLSQYGTTQTEYPRQARDVSYGFAQARTLIHADSPSMYWLPLDSSLGTRWTEPGFGAATAGFSSGTASLGYESRPDDRTNFSPHILTPVREGATSVYTRMEFDLDVAADVSALKLRLKYDNGFIAYLNGVRVAEDNAPANPDWFSTAPGSSPRDSQAIQFAEFDLTEHAGLLLDGANVLAIHGLNHLQDNSDMLLVAELVADRPLRQAAVGYLPAPTPGGPNFALETITGPLIDNVTENPGALDDNQDLVVTARLRPHNAPITSASLVYRVMYDNEITLPMLDDGSGADATAGDGVHTAVIPNAAAGPGEMVRWRVTALDVQGNRSRAPMFHDQDGTSQSPEYYGTVVVDPSLAGTLPVLQWFTENERGTHGRSGARVSVFYDGEFYDNAFARQRGGATNAAVSQKFVFNRGEEFRVNDKLGRVREFNMNGQGSDPSYLRQTMAHEAYTAAGNGSSESFLLNMQVNGEFDRVGIFIEQVDEDFLQRLGLNPEGALYKFVQRSNLGAVFSDTVTGIEKKTQLTMNVEPVTLDNGQQVTNVQEARLQDQDVSDIQEIVDGLGLPTAEERKQYLYDNFDIPQLMNYLAVRSVTLEADDVRKNFYLYRDTSGSGQWSIYPWDKDWTFGVEGDGAPHLRNPFFGDRDHAKANANQWNVLYTVAFEEASTREMFLRRLRSVMDQFLGPPGTPAGASYYEQRAAELFAAAESLLPRGASSQYQSMIRPERGFFDRRRKDLYENHSINNPDFRDNAGIPDAQTGNPTITFGQVEYDPASGIQDEEFIELRNPNPTAVDISGWRLTGGIEFTFKAGTVIPAGGSLYVSPNVSAFRARTSGPTGGQGLFIQGNYDGHLSRDGETVSLIAADGRIVRRVSVGGVPSPAEQLLRVTEVNFQPFAPNPLPGLGEFDDGTPNAADRFEFVELINTGEEALDLSGVQFTAGVEFTFAQGTRLSAGEYILVVKDEAALQSRYGSGLNIAGQFSGTLADEGESVFLDTASGRAIQAFSYGVGGQWSQRTAGRGSSLEVIDPRGSLDLPDNWQASAEFGGSPGQAAAQASDTVMISEVLAHSDPASGDMIELRNPGGSPQDISNWYLSNSDADYFKFRVPAGTTLASEGYQAFDQTELGFDMDRARGDDVWLIAADADGRPLRFVDRVEFGPSARGVSLGPWPSTSDPWIMLARPTFGGTNSGPYVGPVVLSEVYYSPADPDRDGRMKPDDVEFVELYNRGDSPVDVSNWQITGDIELVIPAGTQIGAQQALLVVGFDPSDPVQSNVFRFTLGANASAGLAGPFTPTLNDESGSIQLIRPDAPPEDDPTLTPLIFVDEVSYSSSPPWPASAAGAGDSLARTQPTNSGTAPTSWIAAAPTPGSAEFVTRVVGDANGDGQFNQLDLVQVQIAGKFMTDQPATWSEGDWNGDERFDQLDLVAVLQTVGASPFQQNAGRPAPAGPHPLDVDTEVEVLDAWFARI